jgi:hypothetical protein
MGVVGPRCIITATRLLRVQGSQRAAAFGRRPLCTCCTASVPQDETALQRDAQLTIDVSMSIERLRNSLRIPELEEIPDSEEDEVVPVVMPVLL